MTLIEDIIIPSLTVAEQSSAPAVPPGGDQTIYIRTSDHHLVREDSSGTIVDLEAGGGGGGGGGGTLPAFLTFVAPPTTSWTWDNQGGGTLDSTADSQYLVLPNTSGLNLRVRYRTAPATPYTITTAFLADLSGAPGAGDEAFTALCFRDSTGKLVHWGYGYASGVPYITLGKWNSATSYSADYLLSGPKGSAGIFVARSPNWLRIQDNGTNLIFSYSIDAVHWVVFDTHSRTDWFASGPTQIGFGACPRGSGVEIALVSYEES